MLPGNTGLKRSHRARSPPADAFRQRVLSRLTGYHFIPIPHWRSIMFNYDRLPPAVEQARGYSSALLAGFCFALGGRLAEALWVHASGKLKLENHPEQALRY